MMTRNYDPSFTEAEPLEPISVTEPLSADFIICLPPPNVTGELHLGHALNSTLQDILIRFRRLKGQRPHWQIGCDHAGIGTQIVVEKQLAAQGLSKYDLGREKFQDRAWEWTNQYLGRIESQLRRLGCSPDWSKTVFTLNPEYSQAVREAFFELYREGLVYRGKRLINWCPKCLTSLSDLEVIHEDQSAKLYEIVYPPVDESLSALIVATSRPETIFADTALAINPKDDRYAQLTAQIESGEEVFYKIPLSERAIPVILSEKVLLDFGTGVLKVTPGHDFNDAEIARIWNQAYTKRAISTLNILDERAHLLDLDDIPDYLHGLERYTARKLTVSRLEEKGLLVAEKSYKQPTSLHDRCGTAIEPYLSEQTFLSMPSLADLALKALQDDAISFYPDRYAKTYQSWLEKIEDWCISRQLWWGHQIPVWRKELPSQGDPEKTNREIRDQFRLIASECGYPRPLSGDISHPTHLQARKAGNEYVWQYGEKQVEICLKSPDRSMEQKLEEAGYIRDTDVLDTWFSSALWPIASQGWPKAHTQRKFWSDTLCTAREIINLWVSRMIFMSLKLTGKLPFQDILIHPVVQTPDGKRMSKSKGNAIEPIMLVEKYGADACRLWYCSVGIFGNQDIRFPGKKEKDGSWSSPELEQKRRFLNKLWNAANFIRSQFEASSENNIQDLDPGQIKDTSSLWILAEAGQTFQRCEAVLEQYGFSAYVISLEKFFWNNFCDWYLEIAKLNLAANSQSQKDDIRLTMKIVMSNFLRYLEPVTPFIVSHMQGEFSFSTRIPPASAQSKMACQGFADLESLVSSFRSIRQKTLGMAPNQTLTVSFVEPPDIADDLHWMRLALVERSESPFQRTFQKLIPLSRGNFICQIFAPPEIDLGARASQIDKDRQKKKAELNMLELKLSDSGFVQNASEELKLKIKNSLDLINTELTELEESMNLVDQILKEALKNS